MNRLLLCTAVLAGFSVSASPLEFRQNGGWKGLEVVSGKDGSAQLRTADGKCVLDIDMMPRCASDAKPGLELTDDGLKIDLRPAFAAGANRVWLRSGEYEAAALADKDVEIAAEMSGGRAVGDWALAEIGGTGVCADGTFGIRGRRNKVITTRVRPICPGRHRQFVRSVLPGDVKTVRATIEFSAAGGDVITFHGFSVAPAKASPVAERARPKLLFHLTFDGTLDAAVAGGARCPVVTNALSFVKGRRGRAVRFDRAAGSRLVYRLKDNANPDCGTMTCWMKHDLPVDKSQTLFATSAGSESGPGDGALSLGWTGYGELGVVELARNDYERTKQKWGPSQHPLPTNGWVQLTFVWNRFGQTLYANGTRVPRGRISDNTCPLYDLYFEPNELMFAEGWRQKISLLMIGCGSNRMNCWNGAIDELKVWDRPFTPAEAASHYNAEIGRNAGGDDELPMWDEPWRNPSAPPPPNRALGAATDTPGVPANMELVEEVLPSEIAQSGDASRFRAAGRWRTGVCDGTPYLEAGSGLNDRFAIRFRLDGTVPLWCFELTYPDDRARAIDLVVQNSRRPVGYSLNSGIETGLEHPLTGRNAVKRFLFWRDEPFADPEANGDVTLVAMTQTEDNPAALSRIRVYAIRDGRIPETKMCDAPPVNGLKRRSAIWFEDPAIMLDFGVLDPNDDIPDPLLLIDRIAAYMKYTGQDTLVYPSVWYSGIIGANYMPRKHMPHYMREVCRRFERDGLAFVPSINQQRFPQFEGEGRFTRSMLTDGTLHATPISILDTGLPNAGGWHHTPTYYNIAHPDVQRALLREIELVCAECGEHRSFLGMAIDPINAINVTSWGAISAGYNDYCIDAFERATGVKVPVDRADPMRGREYAKWLTANAYEPWVQWRCDVVTDFYRRAAETLRKCRPDLMLFVRCSIVWRMHLEQREDLFRDDFADRILKESGIDCAALSKLPGVSLALSSMPAYWHDELHRFKAPTKTLERIRDLPETDGYQRLILGSAYPFADFHESYYETSVGSKKKSGRHSGDGRLSGDWLVEKPWRVTHFAASGREALRPYAKALAAGDVFAFGRGGYLLGTCGDEAVTAPFMRTFRALPAVKFADVAGFSHPSVKFRTAKSLGKTWYYAVNVGFEPVEADLPLTSDVVDAVTGEKVGRTLRLDSYEIRAFSVPLKGN